MAICHEKEGICYRIKKERAWYGGRKKKVSHEDDGSWRESKGGVELPVALTSSFTLRICIDYSPRNTITTQPRPLAFGG